MSVGGSGLQGVRTHRGEGRAEHCLSVARCRGAAHHIGRSKDYDIQGLGGGAVWVWGGQSQRGGWRSQRGHNSCWGLP